MIFLAVLLHLCITLFAGYIALDTGEAIFTNERPDADPVIACVLFILSILILIDQFIPYL